MSARVIGAFEEIKLRHSSEAVLIVTHVNPLRVMLAHALGMTTEEIFRTRLGNCAVNILNVDGARCDLIIMNDTSHLEEFGDN
jgi:broad specificity phosphatase PhoE